MEHPPRSAWLQTPVQRKARRPSHQGVIWATVNSDGRRQAPARDREHADLRPGLEVLLSARILRLGREQDFQSWAQIRVRGSRAGPAAAISAACAGTPVNA